jgi:hypothetical protein
MISLKISGIDGVQQSLARLVPQSERAILELAEKIHDFAREGADTHTKTGALKRSLGHGPKKIAGGWEIGHDKQVAPYAAFVHWGTRPHVIKPKNKKALRWAAGGAFAFAKKVNHPGYKGDPWLTRAADRALREFDGIVKRNMKG